MMPAVARGETCPNGIAFRLRFRHSVHPRHELPHRLRRIPRGVVVHESDDRHALAQQPDRPGVGRHLAAAVDDDVIELRRQGIDGLAIPSRRR